MHEQRHPVLILRRRAVEARTGLSRSTLYDWMNPSSPRYKPDFPKPMRFSGSNAVGWVANEIDDWLTAQVQASREAS
ncbi:AlpA family transcriptional regulator [Nevskia sp.]|uniref:helix-turn-helix transcriptional regulator n=1 Tax=Nevskia sp. TaxID=1929292 RepID=UPI0025E06172|nr:AlpA family phage regulatory protein [Nevskia sp.]